MNYHILGLALLTALLNIKVAFGADEIHWTVIDQNSVTFSWRGPEKTIRYGTEAGKYDQEVTAKTPTPLPFSSSGPFWEAKLTKLRENTVYHYAVGEGPDRTFRTPLPRGKGGFTIYVEGDIGDTDSYFNVGAVQDLIADGSPQLVLAVGDLTYGGSHGQKAVDQHFNDVMVWSQEAAYMPAWGNDEWDHPTEDDLRNYKGRFDLSHGQSSPGSPSVSCCGKDWYWFDYGNTRFIAYPEPWSGALADWEGKAKALMEEAQADSAIKFIVTFGHRPAYSSGHHPGETTLKEILDGLGSNYSKYILNLNGHSHDYERTHPQQGVVHITAAGGGASLEQDGSCLWRICTKPSWSAFRAMRLGPVRLKFTDSGIQGAFICGPPGGGTNDINCTPGSVVDSFTIGAKTADTPSSGATSDTIPPTVPKNLAAKAISDKEISLSWSASTDNVGVTDYHLYRDGRQIASTASTSYHDSGLSPSTAYHYTVAAADGAGNLSQQSDPVTVTTTSDSAGGSSSGTLTFIPSADTYVQPGTSNKGSEPKLWVDGGSNPYEILLKFSVSGVGAGAVTNAKLHLYVVHGSAKGGDFYQASNNDWTERGVTWDNAPAAEGSPLISLGPVSSGNWIDVDVTPFIKGDGTYSLRVKTTASDSTAYYSKEQEGFAPQLIVGVGTATNSQENSAGNTAVSKPTSTTANNSETADPSTSTTSLVTDENAVFSVPQVPKPAYLTPVTDPTFGIKITRITGDSGTTIPSIGGKWGSDARHHYSKDQPWNSDGTLLAEQNSNSPTQLFLDGNTYQPKYARCSNYNAYEDRWHPSPQHPNERISLKDSILSWFDVVNCAETRRWQLPFAGSISEGNTSIDGRYFLIFDTARMVIVDMDPQTPLDSYASGNKRIGPVYDFSKCGLSNCQPDWASISPSGKYAIVQYGGDHARVFDVNPKTLALTPRPMPSTSPQCGSNQTAAAGYIYNVGHADMTLNPFDNNEDVIVGQRRSWCASTVAGQAMGSVVMVRLKDNTVTTLTDPSNEAYSYHVSTRNYDRPGWAYVGYYPQQNGKRFNDEIIAVKLDGSKSVERLAHQHSNSTNCYRCEPHPVPSRDGRRVLWASNWTLNCGSRCGSSSDIKDYVVDTRH
jgi:hypothetical protein